MDAHEKTVELRLRERECADLVRRVLRGDHEERLGEAPRFALGRHLVLFHRFKQRALCLGRGPVDFVGEHNLAEDRAGVELEAAGIPVIDGDPDDVGGEEIAGELDALERESERSRQRVRERGLAHARDVLDQQVAAREQAGERHADLRFLAEDDLPGGIDDAGHWRIAGGVQLSL
ncbi:hypothetical protein D3C83_15620 [compost metagenome]